MSNFLLNRINYILLEAVQTGHFPEISYKEWLNFREKIVTQPVVLIMLDKEEKFVKTVQTTQDKVQRFYKIPIIEDVAAIGEKLITDSSNMQVTKYRTFELMSNKHPFIYVEMKNE